MNQNVFSENMKKFRQAKNFTQEQVAEKLSVSSQTVSRWECGNTLPDVLMLPEIARLYGVLVDDLFKKQSIAYENYAQRLATVYERTRDPEDFLRCRIEFQKLMKNGEDALSLEDMWQYAWLHADMGDECDKQALLWYDKVLAHTEESHTHQYARAASLKIGLLFSMGKGQEFIKEQRSKLEAADWELDARQWIMLIDGYDEAKEYETAYELCHRAIQKYPDNWELYINAANICIHLKKYEEAMTHIEKAGQLGTYFVDEKWTLTELYRRQGMFDKVRDTYLEIAEILRSRGFDEDADMAVDYAKQAEAKIEK